MASTILKNTCPRYRIVVIGAGTAGLAAAIALAKTGHEVRVLEKHPALTSRGAGLLIQPQGVRALQELGVGSTFEATSVPIRNLTGRSHRNWLLVDIPYQGLRARAVSRAALSELLYAAVQDAGVTVQFGHTVQNIEVLPDGKASISGPDFEHSCDLVVLAEGTNAELVRQVGLPVQVRAYEWGALWGMFDVTNWPHADTLEQRFRGTHQMYGLMPTASREGSLYLSLFWSLPANRLQDWHNQSLEAWKAELLNLWPESAPVLAKIRSHADLAFAKYQHVHLKALAKGPVCVIGDAAHAMSPQLGMGTTLAVQDALLLAKTLAEHGLAGLPAYSRRRLRTVHCYQWLSKVLTPCFQREGTSWWRDIGFAVSLKIPGVRYLMRRSLVEPGN